MRSELHISFTSRFNPSKSNKNSYCSAFGMLTVFLFIIILFFTTPGSAQVNENKLAKVNLPSDEEIHKILVDRVDSLHRNLGMVVGIITPEGRRIISYGKMNDGDQRPLNGETVFEIGSMTKIFTALSLSNMAQRGEVNINDPLSKYLPSNVKVPERNGKQITLIDLATHTSGLPFWPGDVPLNEEGVKIMSAYSSEKLYKFLSSYKLSEDIGSKWAYSNLGMGLVGIALCNYSGKDYETLIREQITGPLKMNSTSVIVSSDMKTRIGSGHDANLKPAPDWNIPVLPGAGSLHSTANDLLTFLAAFMDYDKTPLSFAMKEMFKVRRLGPNLQQALGWWIIPFAPGDSGIVTFGGQTLGYTSTIAFDPENKIGIVVLSNGVGTDGALAWHLLRPDFPVETSAAINARNKNNEIKIDPVKLEGYQGKFQVNPDLIITIECKDSVLVMKDMYTPPEGLILHASDQETFFVKEVDLKVKFKFNGSGNADSIIIHFAGTDTKADRI